MPETGKGISKEEQERRAQKVKDAKLKRQRNFRNTPSNEIETRKINTTTPSSIYVAKEKEVNEITPKGIIKPGPFAKLGQREIDSEGPFRKNVTGPILKHCGGK